MSTTTFISQNKNIARFALATVAILIVPLIAMQFTNEVNWTLFDFVVAGVLLFGSGAAFELISRRGGNSAYRFATGTAVFTSLVLIWMNLAVGLIGSENNPANLLYLGVLLVGLIGAALANLKPAGMSRTLFAMAVLQLLVPVAALVFMPGISWGAAGVKGVLFLNGVFVLLFAAAGLMYRRAGSQTVVPG